MQIVAFEKGKSSFLAGAKDGRPGELESTVRVMTDYVNGTDPVQARERAEEVLERWTAAGRRSAGRRAQASDEPVTS